MNHKYDKLIASMSPRIASMTWKNM